jgi:hypothetical protein
VRFSLEVWLIIEGTRWNVPGFHLLCRVLTWKIKHQSNSTLSVSSWKNYHIQAPRFQSSGGMAWHGLLARRAEEALSAGFGWFLSCQFQGATGAEAPSHGCRAARLLCALV